MNVPYLLNSLAWALGGAFLTLFFAWVTGRTEPDGKFKFPRGPGLASVMSVIATIAGVLVVLAYQVEQDNVNDCFRQINSENSKTSIALRVLADKDRALDMQEKQIDQERTDAQLALYQAISTSLNTQDIAGIQGAVQAVIATSTTLDGQQDVIDSQRAENADARKALPTQDPVSTCDAR